MCFKEFVRELYGYLSTIDANNKDKTFYFAALNQLDFLSQVMQKHTEKFERFISSCAYKIKDYSDRCTDTVVKNGLQTVSYKLLDYLQTYKEEMRETMIKDYSIVLDFNNKEDRKTANKVISELGYYTERYEKTEEDGDNLNEAISVSVSSSYSPNTILGKFLEEVEGKIPETSDALIKIDD